MSPNQASAGDSKGRCLVLLLEPTPYILPRARYLKQDPALSIDLYFTFVNTSQPWGADADAEGTPVVLDRSVSALKRVRNVMGLLWRILRGDYAAAEFAGWAHWLVRLSIVACHLRGVPFAIESDTPLGPSRGGWREVVKNRLYPLWMRWITVAIPGGSRQADYFRHYGVPEDRIVISHMSVDTTMVRAMNTPSRAEFRQSLGIQEDQLLLLFVGRLVEQKGIDTLLQAFETVASRVPRISLAVVGDGPERSLIDVAARRFPGRLWAPGRVDQRGVISWMRSSDVFILPSHREPWGLVVNEAMACGLPIVVSDACGCVDDLVANGRNGFVFRAGNVEKLAEAMVELAECVTTRTSMGENSLKTIEPWTVEREAEIFRSVLHRMSGKP